MLSAMSKQRPYHHGDLRSALLEHAEQTLRERGVEALSLRELAREIGVSHAAPSRHFKDKRALLDALAVIGFERLADAMEKAHASGGGIEQRLIAHGRVFMDFVSPHAALLDLMYARKHDPELPEQLAAAVTRVGSGLRVLIADAQAAGELRDEDPERVARVVGSAMHGLTSLLTRDWIDRETADQALRDFVRHLLYGLAPGRTAP
jgi:AcrR family transcriptional regulator